MATTTALDTKTDGSKQVTVERVSLDDYAEQLTAAFAAGGLTADQLCGLGDADLLRMPAGVEFFDPSMKVRAFWILLEGEIKAEKVDADGVRMQVHVGRPGDSFGEVVLLMGKESPYFMTANVDSVGLKLDEETFWRMMSCSPPVRKVVMANMSQRMQAHMAEAAHREKLISLGTMAAGLMHELHNPGSAAKRAASQLRGNLEKLQELTLRSLAKPKGLEQIQCMHGLVMHAVHSCHTPAMSSLDQADAEEAMSEWLDAAGVENAFKIGPQFVAIGYGLDELDCAKALFDQSSLSDMLNWLEALVSSVSLVCAIEESITRVSDLVMAVKKFAYDDRCALRQVDVHDSIQSTLTILAHKMRQRGITVGKHFGAKQPILNTTGVAVSQVWTNLIDNAIDASPEGGEIEVKTWSEPGFLAVSIGDHGSGIPDELRKKIFDPFFTTKPVGKGTGLGLEIVQRIVTQNFGGKIDIDSKPGNTQFVIRLPQGAPDTA
jgi:signal transduction histidine kinase